MTFTHDTQQASETCPHCGKDYEVRRGQIYVDGIPQALYLAGLHGCGEAPIVALGLAVRPSSKGQGPLAVTVGIRSGPRNFELSFMEPEISPWRSHEYLGRMLSPEEAREESMKRQFIPLADHLLTNDPHIREFLDPGGS